MARSTRAQQAQRLNAAYGFLAEGCPVPDAVARLRTRFGMSRRQAHRYVRAARSMEAPVAVSESSVPITVKIPARLVTALRGHAAGSGLTIGEIVSRALAAFFRRSDGDG